MSFNSDTPISSAEENKFSGRDSYAKSIAKAIKSLQNDQSFVVALYSKWGYGKTSVMNMVKQQLKESKAGKNIFCIDLAPWNFVSSGEIARYLFYELAEDCNNHKIKRFLQKKKEYIKPTINSVSGIAQFVPGFGSALGSTLRTSNEFISAIGIKSYQKIKSELEKDIKKTDKKVVVFIDDIDRLDAEGVLDTFKLIKSVANIEGVVFFLAFDYEAVTTMLNKLHMTERGKDFIDKIVQIPLELPHIDRIELDDLFISGLNNILAHNHIEAPNENNSEASFELFYKDVKKYIDTPRSISRILNVLEFVIPLLGEEVNTLDIIRLEMIRVFKPELYNILKNNKAILTDYSGIEDIEFSIGSKEEKKEIISELFQNDAENIKLASYLFPIIKTEYYNQSDFRDNNQSARMMKRVNSAAYFDRYFSYSIGENDVSDGLFIDIVKKPKITQQDIAMILQSPNQIGRILEKISDNAEHIVNKYDFCSELILFLDNQDWAYEKHNLVFKKIDSALYAMNELLLHKPNSSDNNLKTYLKIAKKVSPQTLAYSIRSVYFANNDEGSNDKKTLNERDYSKYKKEIVKIIQKMIQNNELPIAEYKTVSKELYKYHLMFSGGSEEINKYMKRRVKTADEAIDFVSQFLNRWTNVSDGIAHNRDLFDENFAVYKHWFIDGFDASYLYSLIVQSQKYKKYKNIPLENIKRFDKLSELTRQKDINIEGKEQSNNFREVIAQQFIYIFNSGITKEK